MKKLIWIAVPALTLAACGEKASDNSGDVSDVTINAKGEDGGTVSITADGSGSKVSINGDGVNINADLPGIDGLNIGSDFDIDGVKLYPGAKITSVNIDANAAKPEGKQGLVRFGMTAPAAPATVLDWYAKAFAAKGISAAVDGNALNGETKDGDAFTIQLAPDGAGSKGEVRISG
jgi:hypothetical protein